MTTPTTSARLDEHTDRRVTEIVRRRGITRSDWLREAVEAAIKAETDGDGQAAIVANIAARMTSIEDDLRQTFRIAEKNLQIIKELSNATAIERAADRAVAQQVYRMALRAAFVSIKAQASQISEEDQVGFFNALCAEADSVYEDDGLLRLEQEMTSARDEVRQSIEQAGAS